MKRCLNQNYKIFEFLINKTNIKDIQRYKCLLVFPVKKDFDNFGILYLSYCKEYIYHDSISTNHMYIFDIKYANLIKEHIHEKDSGVYISNMREDEILEILRFNNLDPDKVLEMSSYFKKIDISEL